ncbi:MAG: HAD hydrolase-like protein [Myxococcales bacterium]|nr:HAD hydrolase-like protein [Myxococcales bacterium]
MFRLLALDFDGVISDSAPEAFAVALLTYTEMLPDSRFRERGERFVGDAAPAPGVVTGDDLYAAFLDIMPLGNRAEDYGVILSALEGRGAVPDQAAYDALREGIDAAWLRAYHKRFYEVRAALARRDPVGWRRLIRPYPAFLEMLRRRSGEVMLTIATAKDRRSVREILRHFGIDDLFPEGLVLDKETGVSKAAHLEHLHRSLAVDYPEMTFIDDKVTHLGATAALGVRSCLAAWGYNGPREASLARARGHPVCTLENVERQLFG